MIILRPHDTVPAYQDWWDDLSSLDYSIDFFGRAYDAVLLGVFIDDEDLPLARIEGIQTDIRSIITEDRLDSDSNLV